MPFQHVIDVLKTTNEIFLHSFSVVSLRNLVCVLCLPRVSIWTGHTSKHSRATWPVAAILNSSALVQTELKTNHGVVHLQACERPHVGSWLSTLAAPWNHLEFF